MNRKLAWLVTPLLLACIHLAEAQQPEKVHRIGYLSTVSRSSAALSTKAFREGLAQLGYIEGQNIRVEYRYAEGKLERLPDLAGELIRLKVDAVVTAGAAATKAVQSATRVTPIVMTNVSDPVVLGFVASLARPGENITGLSNLAPEVGGKRLELLKEIVPQLSRVAVLGEPGDQAYRPQMNEIEVAAPAFGLQIKPMELRDPNDLENTFSMMNNRRPGALIALAQPTLGVLRERIVKLVAKNQLPATYPNTEFVNAGGLMSYGTNIPELHRRAATYVDKILKGTKPGELPIEQPTKFELVINLKAAKQIGLTIPPNVLARADKVIK